MSGISSTSYLGYHPITETNLPHQTIKEPIVSGKTLNSRDHSDASSDEECSLETDPEVCEGFFGVDSSPVVRYKNTADLSKDYKITDQSRFLHVTMRCSPRFVFSVLSEEQVKDAAIEGNQIELKIPGYCLKLTFNPSYGLTRDQVIKHLAQTTLEQPIVYEDLESIDIDSLPENSIDVESLKTYTYLLKV